MKIDDLSQSKICNYVSAQQVKLSSRDPVTKLPDCEFLTEMLAMAIRLARCKGHELAVLCIDLSGFHRVCAQLGHKAGNTLLRKVAERLQSSLHESDILARTGTNEFIVVQTAANERDAGQMALDLQKELSRPLDLGGLSAKAEPWVGLSVFPGDGDDPATLIGNAGIAARQLSETAGSIPCFFDPATHSDFLARLALEADLLRALENDELALLYQPVVALPQQRVAGVEALLRWNHPEHGLIGPEVFLCTTENRELVSQIARWVITEACRQISVWQVQGLSVGVSVSISNSQIPDGISIDWLVDTLAHFNVRPGALRFELTDSTLIHKTPAVSDWLNGLDQLRIRIALDDFGSGLASLAALRQHNLHEIKIDRSLIRGMSEDARTRDLVKSMIDIGNNMMLAVTAEGVEDAETLAALQSMGCGFAQGMHLARPMPPEKLLNFCMATTTRSSLAVRQAMFETNLSLSLI